MIFLSITLFILAIVALLFFTFNLSARRWAVNNFQNFRIGAIIMGLAQAVTISEARYSEMPEFFDMKVGLAILAAFGTFIWAYLVSKDWPSPDGIQSRSAEQQLPTSKGISLIQIIFYTLVVLFFAALILSFFDAQLTWWPPFYNG